MELYLVCLLIQEKEVLIASLKRELKESKELLAAAEKSTAEMALTSGSRSLSPQTQQQIAHLRSELQRARSALMAMQERSGSESEGGEVAEQRDDVQKLEAELKLLRSSASMSAKDYVKVRSWGGWEREKVTVLPEALRCGLVGLWFGSICVFGWVGV